MGKCIGVSTGDRCPVCGEPVTYTGFDAGDPENGSDLIVVDPVFCVECCRYSLVQIPVNSNKWYRVDHKVDKRIEFGHYRDKHGLDTGEKSTYHHYRNHPAIEEFGGDCGDEYAQLRVYLERGILKIDEKLKIIREVDG